MNADQILRGLQESYGVQRCKLVTGPWARAVRKFCQAMRNAKRLDRSGHRGRRFRYWTGQETKWAARCGMPGAKHK